MTHSFTFEGVPIYMGDDVVDAELLPKRDPFAGLDGLAPARRASGWDISPPEHGPFFLRWCNPDLDQRGDVDVWTVSPGANPFDRELAEDICRFQARKYPMFLWFVSNKRASRIVSP